MRKMLDFKFNVSDSKDILDYAISKEQLAEKAEFKPVNKKLGAGKKKWIFLIVLFI